MGRMNKHCLCVIFFALILCFTQQCFANQKFNHYSINAYVDVSQKIISADQTVQFVNQSKNPIMQVYFHIYPNRQYTSGEIKTLFRYAGYFKVDPYPDGFMQGDMKILYVKEKGKDLDYVITGKDRTLLRVDLSVPLEPEKSLTLDLSFQVSLPHAYGRFGWHKNIIKAAYWYPLLAIQTENGWNNISFFPFHRPFYSDASLYDVTLTVPSDQLVAHSGFSVSEDVDGENKKIQIKTEHPIRTFSFAMSPDYKKMKVARGNTELQIFYLSGDEKRARDALAHVKSSMDYYERIFNISYPYRQFSVVVVHLGYGGEQMANMIFIDTRVFKLPALLDRHFDMLISHETGHQWIYNMLGVDAYREMWLEEGLNSYLILDYIEGKYGYDANILTYPDWFKDWEWTLPKASFRRLRDYRYKMGIHAGIDGALVEKLDSFSEPSLIFALIYGKGVRVWEALESYIGKESLKRVFKLAVTENQFENWSVEMLREICEKESGLDLKDFFEQWLYTGKQLDFSVRAVKRGVVYFENLGDITIPVSVQIVLDGGIKRDFILDGSTQTKTFSENVLRVVIDPQQKMLDVDRLNNIWPRKINVKPVPIYFGLWDNPLFLPEDSYNIVFGPEIYRGVGVKASWQKPYDYIVYTGSDYSIADELWTSRLGFQIRNFLKSSMSFGTEIRNVKDASGGPDDLFSTKLYLRKNLWPVAYGMLDVQDHVTMYLIRNQRPDQFDEGLAGREDVRNIEYKRDEESIVGVSYHLNHSAPYPDPKQGFRVNAFVENAGHFAGGGSYFYRGGADTHVYIPIFTESKFVLRGKFGMGYPNDKDMFQLGGIDGLRGYDRKELRGANAILGIVEYRFPLFDDIDRYVVDRIFGFRKIDGVVFFEAGQAWFSSVSDSELKKDVGIGLRLHVDLLGFLEKSIIQIDIANAINDSEEDTHVWFSINSSF